MLLFIRSSVTLFLLFVSWSYAEITLSSAEAQTLAQKIWQNESGGRESVLTHWNRHEAFASLGMGHFIWYPANTTERPYREMFPEVLRFLQQRGHTLPAWLTPETACPWPDRETFYADFDSPRLTELRAFLKATFPDQTRFMAERMRAALPKILAVAPADRREHIADRFNTLAATPEGLYILMDYVNFKGEGTLESECYRGEGWGLLQVLNAMPEHSFTTIRDDFAKAADFVLTRRVLNAPKEERQWLPGWRKRLESYTQ